MMFTIRTSPVTYGTKPYVWNIPSVYQCVWFAYYRCSEAMPSAVPPCWWDRATQTGSYTNAKDWLANYRDPWEVKEPGYIPVAGDVVVFDGEYGHVAFIEKVEGDTCLLSQYMNGDENSFSNVTWKTGTDYTGKLLGYLHYPYEALLPVERNEEVDQIQTTDDSLRIRTKPSLSGEIVGYVGIGYYNVLDMKEADGYTWYQIAKNRWCANVSTVYLPSDSDDAIRQLEAIYKALKNTISEKQKTIDSYKTRMQKIHELSEDA